MPKGKLALSSGALVRVCSTSRDRGPITARTEYRAVMSLRETEVGRWWEIQAASWMAWAAGHTAMNLGTWREALTVDGLTVDS